MLIFGFVFESHGVCISIRANTPELLDSMQKRLPPLAKLTDAREAEDEFSVLVDGVEGQRVYALYHGSELLIQTGQFAIVLDELESQLHAAVALGSTQGLFVHAGVVGWKGGAIVIPGRSMSGKTSLVAALVQAGADYYSDEYAVFDPHGYVHAYPKPLNIRVGQNGQRKKCRAEELGGQTGMEALPLALVVSTHYDPKVSWEPQPLTSGQAVLRLFDNTIDALGQPIYAINTFAIATAKCVAIGGARPPAHTVVPALLEHCETVMKYYCL